MNSKSMLNKHVLLNNRVCCFVLPPDTLPTYPYLDWPRTDCEIHRTYTAKTTIRFHCLCASVYRERAREYARRPILLRGLNTSAPDQLHGFDTISCRTRVEIFSSSLRNASKRQIRSIPQRFSILPRSTVRSGFVEKSDGVA